MYAFPEGCGQVMLAVPVTCYNAVAQERIINVHEVILRALAKETMCCERDWRFVDAGAANRHSNLMEHACEV